MQFIISAEEYSKLFGKHLKRLLDERKMMQKDLAVKAEITEAAVSRYVRGERTPRIPHAYRIACVLGIDMNTLTMYLKEGEKQ